MRWLEALVWPEEADRLERLRKAIPIAREERPRVVRGDLLDVVRPLALEAPADATLVIFHTAVLAFLSADERRHFAAQVRRLPGEWISNEGPDVLPEIPSSRAQPKAASHFVIGRNGRWAVAFCDPHGRWLQWTG